MSKKQKAVEEQEVQKNEAKKQPEKNVKEENKAEAKKAKKDKKKKEKENKGGLGKKAKETMSELKKVTWPSFGEVVKKTGIVVAFVVLFGLFFYGVNALLGWLSTLLA